MGYLPCEILCVLFFLLHSQLITLLFSSPTTTTTTTPLCPYDQSLSLLQFKNMFSIDTSGSLSYYGPFWEEIVGYPKTKSWKEGTNCCRWDGVKCENGTGNVIGLDLSCSLLRGSIHSNSSLFLLQHLNSLNLAFNDFDQSKILSEFGGLVSLTHLNLSSSNFSGQVSMEISHLSRIVSLDLSNNYHLTVDNLVFKRLLRNLTELKQLVLDGIDMFFVVPSSLRNISSSLTCLSLASCELEGKFPTTIVTLPNLQIFRVPFNIELTGNFPNSNWSRSLRYVDVSHNNFSGEPLDHHTIGSLTSLQYLFLHDCKFTGLIPMSLGNLTQMKYLDLSYNKFYGQIPPSLANLHQLTQLILSTNHFTGQIPNIFGNLSMLVALSMYTNNFIGKLPHHIFNLTRLEFLGLGGNHLAGPIINTNQIIDLPKLEILDLYGILLTGTLPCFGNMSSLQYLMLQDNKLHGSIPNSIFGLVSLVELRLSSNNLSGMVHLDMFSKLKELVALNLSSNSLALISSNINVNYTMPYLKDLDLSFCNIGEFPHFLKALVFLQYLDLSNNQIQGSIPKWLFNVGNIDSLRYLNLAHNMLTSVDQIPWRYLNILDLRSNLLQGPLVVPPHSIGLSVFIISNNQLTEEIPFSICKLSFLQIIDLSNNSLKGVIPPCLGNFSKLSVLDLHGNRFHGTIPTEFKRWNSLRNMDLSRNQLEGTIPYQLIKCRSLEVIDVGNNKIDGTFPQWLESLPELQVLILRSNKFHGRIGEPKTCRFPFPKLRIMDLSHNDFDGPLPQKYIENLKAVTTAVHTDDFRYMGEAYYRDSIAVTMKGSDIVLVSIQSIFTTIDLSSNNFEGEIPELIGKLISLKGLNLSHNKLAGPIPPSLANLTNLEWLDLSCNKLVGQIPWQMAELTSLEVLNISQNQLVGPIPSGKQFNTFQSDSYDGNLGLCGFPLSERCDGDDDDREQQEGEAETSSSGIDWKFVFIGYGCGMVIGVSLGYLVLSNRKVAHWLEEIVIRLKGLKMVKRPKQNGRRRVGRRN